MASQQPGQFWPTTRTLKIIAMTSFEEEELVHGVLAAGAISYLLKNVTSDELAKLSGTQIQANRPSPPKPPGCLFRQLDRQNKGLGLT
jgi:DNA-binding NarL/FixJ family response regulator